MLNNNKHHCAEVHAVISQYVYDNMTSKEVAPLLHGSMSKHEFVIGRGLLESR